MPKKRAVFFMLTLVYTLLFSYEDLYDDMYTYSENGNEALLVDDAHVSTGNCEPNSSYVPIVECESIQSNVYPTYLAKDHKLVSLRGTVWKRQEPIFMRDQYGILREYDQYIFFHPEYDAVSYQQSLSEDKSFFIPSDEDYIILNPMAYRFPGGRVYLSVNSGGVFFSKVDENIYEVMFFYVDAGMTLYETKYVQSFDVEKKLSYNDEIRFQYQNIIKNKTNMKKYYQVLCYDKG